MPTDKDATTTKKKGPTKKNVARDAREFAKQVISGHTQERYWKYLENEASDDEFREVVAEVTSVVKRELGKNRKAIDKALATLNGHKATREVRRELDKHLTAMLAIHKALAKLNGHKATAE